jgi:hypothetical protein
MEGHNINISKREFLRRSVTLSAGIALMPCSRVFSHPGEEQTGIYKRLAMFQEETPFYPLHKLEQLPPTPVETLRKAHAIAVEEGLKYVYIGNAPESDRSDTLCPACGTRAVERRGYSIAGNNIREGKCGKCGERIEGIWS